MKTENAHFKDLSYWKKEKCNCLSDVLDFARCLENTACPVIKFFHGWDGSENEPLPKVETMLEKPIFDVTQESENSIKTGWMMSKLQLPYIAKYFDFSQWGEYAFTYYSGLDMDIYCDDHPVEIYSYMGGRFDLGVFPDEKEHYVFIRIDSPNSSPVSDITSRCYLKGLNETNELIVNLARSLRAGCHLLSKENRRDNLYIQGTVDIDKSKLSENERCLIEKNLSDTANYIIDMIKKDALIECILPALDMLETAAQYAKRFTIHFIGHSHIDLAWKWRYPETLECMKGTFETQLKLMDRNPEYVYVETSAVLWQDMKEKYPEFWKKIRAAADRGQFEPQGGMWCETDGQCVGAESWFRQIENGQRAAVETCGKKSTCAVNIDGFGFNAGLPKILKKAGLEYFITQKLRYNEFTLFPYVHFWWEGDDGSKILALHEYPAHSNHIEVDEIPKIVCRHHLTDGFYNIPIIWGYGNHGGGPLPVMMDRIDELKTQRVFPNIKYSGFTEFYKTLCEKEDIESLPTVKGELFLETHQKTYTVQSKTKFLNRECERRLLNTESLQAATGEYSDLTKAWEKELFGQFHDVLAGTSMLKVYLDLYEDFDQAFKIIEKSKEKCFKKALSKGDKTYLFNPLSYKIKTPVFVEKNIDGSDLYAISSTSDRYPCQKTWDGKIVFVSEMKPYSFEGFRFLQGDKTESSFSVTENSVENSVIKAVFDKDRGTISSLIYDGREFCGGEIGQFKILEDTKSRDYDSWNFGLTGKEWDVRCDSFNLIESGPVRVVFRAYFSFGLWEEKKPYYGTYLWHTPAVDYPTSFFVQDYIFYKDDPMVRCVLKVDWWEDRKDLKVSAQTTFKSPKAFTQVPFGRLERSVKRDTPYEKARFEVPAQTYAELEDSEHAFTFLNRSKHGYDILNSRIRLTLLTSPFNANYAKVPDSTADRGKHTIEYAFLPHRKDECIEKQAMLYERDIMQYNGGSEVNVPLNECLLDNSSDEAFITCARLIKDNTVKYRTLSPKGELGEKTKKKN